MYLEKYLSQLGKTPGLSDSIQKTVDVVVKQHIQNFSFKEPLKGLLLGNVQSGKTSQIFGIIAAAADIGYKLFLLITSDNIKLQEQTYSRALDLLEADFNICSETDEIRFLQGRLKRPVLVILKKNTSVLKQWKNHLTSSKFCDDQALFIIDDEADAASLNTKVNTKDQSAINKHLEAIETLGSASLYLQVTATPQSLLLQTKVSKCRPSFIYYFPPGKDYIGGDFFYTEEGSFVIKEIPDELEQILCEEEYIPDGLRTAVFSFLVSGSHAFLNGKVD